MKRQKNHKRHPKKSRRKLLEPQTLEQFLAMPPKAQDRWNNITHAVTKSRTDSLSPSRAAKEFDLPRGVVIRLGRSAFRRLSTGRYVPKPWDRLLRVITVNTPTGLQEIATRDSREASIVGMHAAAVLRYLQTGDDSALRNLPRNYIADAKGQRVELLTDLAELHRRGNEGVLSYQSIYARTA
jgi:hypothetical protein